MKWLILLTFMVSFGSFAESLVTKSVVKAINSYEKVQMYKKNAQKHFGITKNHVKYAIIVKAIAAKKFDSRYISDLGYRYNDFSAKFYLTYDTENDHMAGIVNFTLDF